MARPWLADDGLAQYLKNITGSKPLSRERETELAGRIQAGDEAARQELASANLLFVVRVAKQYQNRGLSLAELVSAGNLGLMVAVDRFDGRRGFKFISYAVWWIRQSILKALAEDGRTVRVSVNQLNLIRKIVRASRKLEQENDQVPSVAEIAAELGLAVEKVQEAASSRWPIRSLDNPIWDEEDSKMFLDRLVDESQPLADERALCQNNKDALERLVEALGERERRIVKQYYGLDAGSLMNLEEIGAELGLTRERIRQLKERALRQLHNPAFIGRVLGSDKLAVR